MKKIIYILLVFGLISGACLFAGGKTEEAKKPEGPVTVVLWSWRAWDEPVWQKVQEVLQSKGENIVIDFNAFLPTEYDSKVQVSLQGGVGPDIFYTRRLPGARTQALIDAGHITALDDLVDFSNFTETTLNFIRAGGKTWGVPFANQVIGIFYNTEIFDKYGFQEPKSWDELLDICKKLKADGVTPFMIPGKAAWALAMQHAMTGVSIPGEDWIGKVIKGETNFLAPEFVDLNRRLNDLKIYYQKDFMANTTDEMSAGFALGQAAMVFYGIWEGNTWLKLNPDFKYGYFPVPPKSRAEEARVYVYMDGSFGLYAAAKEKEAALTVLRFTATPEFGTIFANTVGEITAVKGVEMPKDKPILEECYNIANTMAAKNLYWVGSPFSAQDPNVYSVLLEGMQAMYLDQLTPEEVAKRVQEGVATWYKPLMK